MATAVLAAAILTAVPTLPRSDGIDHTADEVRLSIVHQIRAHNAYVHRVRERRTAAQEARSAAQVATTSSTSSSATTYQGGWASALSAAGFPDSAIPTMLYIIQRESGGDPSAINPTSGACGLTQIYPAQPGCLDPMTNLRMAYAKYQASGFAPWGM